MNNHVYTVATRGTQTVAGTLGGVSVLDDDAVRANYTTANSHLKHNWITASGRWATNGSPERTARACCGWIRRANGILSPI